MHRHALLKAFVNTISRAQSQLSAAKLISPITARHFQKSYLIEGDWEPADIYHHDEAWYAEHNVIFHGGVRATGLDLNGQTATLSSGASIEYDKLLLATGADLIYLNVPGSDLEGLYYLRTIPDADALTKASESAKRVVVVGGGFIGLELASAFQQRDLEVLLVYMEDRLWERMLSPEISQWLEDHYRSKEITLISRAQVAEFRGQGQVDTVVLKSGDTLPVDMCALGVGVRPDLTLVKNTPLEGGERYSRERISGNRCCRCLFCWRHRVVSRCDL